MTYSSIATGLQHHMIVPRIEKIGYNPRKSPWNTSDICNQINSLGSRHEAFLSQNIRTCMCSFTFNPAFHQNSKVFSYNLALPLIYCQGVRPFSVKISGLVCIVSHLILLSTKTARYLIIIWPSLWFTVGQHNHRPYRNHWQEISELRNARGSGLIWTWSCLQA